jgi:transposase-like protein
MNTYKRHRFPPDIISHAVWLYYRFNLSYRDIEDLLAERGIELSHEEATRVRERGMRRFKSVRQAQRFLGAHAAVSNLFNLGRHLVRAEHYRDLRMSAFGEWGRAVA